MIILGIDPGVSGAIAMINEEGEIARIEDLPVLCLKKGKKTNTILDIIGLANTLRVVSSLNNAHGMGVVAYVEKAQSMPDQGSASTFKYGKSCGAIEGILAAFNFPFTLVNPRTWKKAMMADMDRKSKDASRYRASQLFPSAADMLSRKKDEHRAEALLIAEYGRREFAK